MLPQPSTIQPWDATQTANLIGNVVENNASYMQDSSLDAPAIGSDPTSTNLASQTYTPFHTAASGAASIPGQMGKTQQMTGISYDPSSFLRDLPSEPTSHLDPHRQKLASNINLIRSMTRGAPDANYESNYSQNALERMGHPNIRSLVEERYGPQTEGFDQPMENWYGLNANEGGGLPGSGTMAQAWYDAGELIEPDYQNLADSLTVNDFALGTEFGGDEGISVIEEMMGDVYGDQSNDPGTVVGLPDNFSDTLQGWNDDFATGQYDFSFGGISHGGPPAGEITSQQQFDDSLQNLHDNAGLTVAQDYLRQHGVIT